MNTITATRIAHTRAWSGKPYAGKSVLAGGTLTIQVSEPAGIPTGATTSTHATTVVAV